MPSNSETILSTQTHPGDSSDQTVTGEKYKGDGYYGRSDGIHTIQYALEGFIGTVSIQATLAVEPGTDDWFTVYTESYPIDSSGSTTTSVIKNFTGNYVWVRAYISGWTDGSVDKILLNH